uniref:Putative secreted protein n=1 Tax=Ixodes ricinus TaxID=34613 RepID=A0A6B0USL3_IXORI
MGVSRILRLMSERVILLLISMSTSPRAEKAKAVTQVSARASAWRRSPEASAGVRAPSPTVRPCAMGLRTSTATRYRLPVVGTVLKEETCRDASTSSSWERWWRCPLLPPAWAPPLPCWVEGPAPGAEEQPSRQRPRA